MHGVEVVAIDLEKSKVRILVGGTESELTFEVPKPSGGPAPGAPPIPGRPGQPMASMNPNVPAAAAQPTIITPGNAQSTGGGGVTLYGGGGTATTANSGVTTLGGAAAVPSPLGTESGLRTIPSRTIRTPNNPNPDQQQQQQMDAAQQQALSDLQNQAQQNPPTYNRRTRQGLQIPQPPLPPNPNPQQPNYQQPH
jgi:hypothetical protein